MTMYEPPRRQGVYQLSEETLKKQLQTDKMPGFSDYLVEILKGTGDSTIRMEDHDPMAADLCKQLHEIINEQGNPPNCEEANAIRAQRPDVFPPQISKLSKKDRLRLSSIEKRPGLTKVEYAIEWEISEASAVHYLNKLVKLGVIYKENFQGHAKNRKEPTIYFKTEEQW